MTINKAKDGNKLVLSLEGRLDTTTAPELEAVVKNELAGVEELVLDFNQLQYISSAGLRVLLSAQKLMTKQGSMVVTNVNDDINEIFDVTGFSDLLTIQ